MTMLEISDSDDYDEIEIREALKRALAEKTYDLHSEAEPYALDQRKQFIERVMELLKGDA